MLKRILGGLSLLALAGSVFANTTHSASKAAPDPHEAQWQREHAAYERDVAYADLDQHPIVGSRAYESSLIEARYHLALARVDAVTLRDASKARSEIDQTREFLQTAETLGSPADRELLQRFVARLDTQLATYLHKND